LKRSWKEAMRVKNKEERKRGVKERGQGTLVPLIPVEEKKGRRTRKKKAELCEVRSTEADLARKKMLGQGKAHITIASGRKNRPFLS